MRLLIVGITLLLAACTATETRRSTGTVVDDVTTATRVKAALVKSPITDGLDIAVRVYQGRVQLNGFADSDIEVTEAGTLTARVRGVNRVANNLRVISASRRAGEYLDDQVLLTRINAALTKDRVVHTNDIDVEVNRGLVILGGFVASDAERQAAEAAANRVPGVDQVRNVIELK